MTVRITFPSYDQGAVDIMAGRRQAGIALAEYENWRAYLYPVAQDRRIRPEGCGEVTARTLGELRRELRERVALKGPWWTD
jgi:hypothetical protein